MADKSISAKVLRERRSRLPVSIQAEPSKAAVLPLHQTLESLLENPQHTSDAATEDSEDNSSVEEFSLV
jgi:hypothetical protein